MNDLFEIVQDLEDIAEFGEGTTAMQVLYTVEDVLAKWKARLLEAQDAAERQEAV